MPALMDHVTVTIARDTETMCENCWRTGYARYSFARLTSTGVSTWEIPMQCMLCRAERKREAVDNHQE